MLSKGNNRKGWQFIVTTEHYGNKNSCPAKPAFNRISAEYAFVVCAVAVDNFFYQFRVRLFVDAR